MVYRKSLGEELKKRNRDYSKKYYASKSRGNKAEQKKIDKHANLKTQYNEHP
jgi:hypothetical protein